jgi:hypothetical protein
VLGESRLSRVDGVVQFSAVDALLNFNRSSFRSNLVTAVHLIRPGGKPKCRTIPIKEVNRTEAGSASNRMSRDTSARKRQIRVFQRRLLRENPGRSPQAGARQRARLARLVAHLLYCRLASVKSETLQIQQYLPFRRRIPYRAILSNLRPLQS